MMVWTHIHTHLSIQSQKMMMVTLIIFDHIKSLYVYVCVPRGNQEIKREKNGMFHYSMMIMIMVLGIEKYFYSSHIQSLSRAQLFIPNIILTKMNKKKINNVLTRKRAIERERHANILFLCP